MLVKVFAVRPTACSSHLRSHIFLLFFRLYNYSNHLRSYFQYSSQIPPQNRPILTSLHHLSFHPTLAVLSLSNLRHHNLSERPIESFYTLSLNSILRLALWPTGKDLLRLSKLEQLTLQGQPSEESHLERRSRERKSMMGGERGGRRFGLF